jgi:hypothetical protein
MIETAIGFVLVEQIANGYSTKIAAEVQFWSFGI